jgi:flagellar basal body rod protein FlgB
VIANMVDTLDFHSKALVLRAERQRIIASNIANADTPGYAARDLDFKQAMNDATAHPTWPTPPRANPQLTVTVWTWTANVPTLQTTPCATKPRCASSMAAPRRY